MTKRRSTTDGREEQRGAVPAGAHIRWRWGAGEVHRVYSEETVHHDVALEAAPTDDAGAAAGG